MNEQISTVVFGLHGKYLQHLYPSCELANNTFSESWFTVFVGSFLGAAFSFGALVYWTTWRDRHNDDRSVKGATDELRINLLHIESNKILLADDISAQEENQTVVRNLTLLQNDELRYALSRLHKHPSIDRLSKKTREVIQLTEMVNQKIKYREVYQIHMESMGNYSKRMTIIDNQTLDSLKELAETISHLISELLKTPRGKNEG